ncbi:hypothetical protein ABFT23_21355 [Nocardioides sp. C4-1]|uniref:hypothetical protein n=1 Tax=Nocardioides sp. C4-1 TaxID=3151851 RepID=UPI003263E723
MASEMRIDIQADGVVVVGGDVEESELSRLRETLHEVITHHAEAWVDLSATGFLPSAAIGVVARATGRAVEQGNLLTIVAADGSRAARTLGMAMVPFEPEISRRG